MAAMMNNERSSSNKLQVDAENPAAVGDELDLAARANWLRAAVLGANDGLVSTASLMLGVGAVKAEARAMVISGFAGLLAGACSMAIGEFVSVCSQRDVELAQLERDGKRGGEEEKALPSPAQAAAASAMAFSVGAVVPLLAAGFIVNYRLRIAVVVAAASVALAAFGCVGAVLGRAAVARSSARVVLGGWAAMGITFGLMRLFKASGI
uniref:Vacuolar iron transporter n=1 Tax=Oryza glumipatula TaxID=40148 RepID=A0A0D9ZSQ9_9ORYZ